MKTCVNNHQNEDESRFCETCGSALPDQPDEPSLSSTDDDPADSGAIAVGPATDVDEADDAQDSDDDLDDDQDNDQDGTDDNLVPRVDPDDSDDDDDVFDPLIVSADDLDDDQDDQFLPPVVAVTPIEQVVQELGVWARENGSEDDPYVQGLTAAVNQRTDLGMWAAIDPLQVLPEPNAGTSRLSNVVRWLTVLRNVLVFLPVALTWMAISRATSEYRDWTPKVDVTPAAGEFTAQEKNFLDFWSNGYGVLDKKWTIPEIGRLDFLIIMVVILLALVISYLNNRAHSLDARTLQNSEAQRTAIGIKIRRSLHGKREASPDSIAESLADALADLTQTTRDMAEVAARLERSSSGVEALTPQMEKLNSVVSTFAGQTSQTVSTAVSSLAASVDKLNTSVTSNLAQVFESAVANLQEAGEQLARTSASLEYGTKLLKDDIEAIRKGLRK